MNPYSTGGSTGVDTGILAGYLIFVFAIAIISVIFSIIIYWKIFSKAGYSGALSLLMLIPIANIVMLCILAFGEWPIYRELNELRQRASMPSQYPGPQYQQYPQYPQQIPQPQQPQYPQYPPSMQ
jgi:hypothetical protein